MLCLGFAYHTMRYPELFAGLRSTGAGHLILDSEVLGPRYVQPMVLVRTEDNSLESNAVPDPYAFRGQTLIGRPSVRALGVMLEMHDYEIEKTFGWQGLLDQYPLAAKVELYRRQTRVTLRAKQRTRSAG